MHKALVIKELRESVGLVALACLAAAYALAVLTATPLLPWQSSRLYTYPFVRDDLSFFFALVVGGLAVALGLKQTAWELGQGTVYFMLHRPMKRWRVFVCKMAVGAVIVLVFSALMLLIYAGWAATPGSFEAPFYWSMTYSAWRMWIAMPPVYFGAFLAGIRPGHWFASRLVPLATGILFAFAAANVPWFWISALISVAASAVLLVGISYYVQQRDY
jgi:hypothetical protein